MMTLVDQVFSSNQKFPLEKNGQYENRGHQIPLSKLSAEGRSVKGSNHGLLVYLSAFGVGGGQ